jgi:hypothetical protein
LPESHGIVPFVLYSDASVLSLGATAGFHAVNVMLAGGTLEEMRSDSQCLRIGFLPEVKLDDLGFPLNPTTEEAQR